MVMFVTEANATPAFCASCARARFSSRRVMANQRSCGMSFALFIAIRQFVLQGFPTTSTRTSVAAFFSNRLALADENLAVDAEQVLAFHARLARHAADEQRPIHTAKTFIEVGRRHHTLEQRKRAIVQFHDDALERAERGRNFDQMKYERLIRSEHRAGGDAKQERVTNLAGGAGDCDFNRSFHGAISHKRFGEQSQSANVTDERMSEASRERYPRDSFGTRASRVAEWATA